MLRTPETRSEDDAQLTRYSRRTFDPLPVDLTIEEIYAIQEIELHRGLVSVEITGAMVRSFRRGTGLFEYKPESAATPPPEEILAASPEAASQKTTPVVFDIQAERRRRALVILGQPELDPAAAAV